jgi:predicted dehydrogenase
MNSRRKFLQKTSAVGAVTVLAPGFTFGMVRGNQNDKLNVGLIGAGLRGTNHLSNLLLRKDVNVVAVCDIDPARIQIAKDLISKAGGKEPRIFDSNEYDYKNLLELAEVDAVIIATPWLWHTRMTVDAMNAGKYAGVEVSAANTLEECWDLVNTHEWWFKKRRS